MRLIGFLIITIMLSLALLSQNSFEITFSSPYHDHLISTFEKNGSYYSLGFMMDSDNIYAHGLIIRYNNSGNQVFKETNKMDSSYIICYGVKKTNNNILFIGYVSDPSQFNFLHIAELTANLEVVWEKIHDITPEGFEIFRLWDMVIDQNNTIVLAGELDNLAGTIDWSLLLIKLDFEGNLLNYNNLESVYYHGWPCADLIVKDDGTGYYYFGGGSYDWVEINSDLQFVSGGFYIGSQSLGSTVAAKYLPDGNLLIATLKSNLIYFYDIHFMTYDSDWQTIKDTIIIEDGRQYPANYKGLDYNTSDSIWVAVHDSWVSPTGTETYKIYIIDSDLNIVASKYFVGENQYDFNTVTATSDGGCIITGTCNQQEGSTLQDIFIKKVMPEDMLTGYDENTFSNLKDVLVFPNPVNDKIFYKTDRKGLAINFYNSAGEICRQSKIAVKTENEMDISLLPDGFYIYSIVNEKGKAIDGGKLIKK